MSDVKEHEPHVRKPRWSLINFGSWYLPGSTLDKPMEVPDSLSHRFWDRSLLIARTGLQYCSYGIHHFLPWKHTVEIIQPLSTLHFLFDMLYIHRGWLTAWCLWLQPMTWMLSWWKGVRSGHIHHVRLAYHQVRFALRVTHRAKPRTVHGAIARFAFLQSRPCSSAIFCLDELDQESSLQFSYLCMSWQKALILYTQALLSSVTDHAYRAR